jgi:lipopolysaccharide/colanic/teichoic acid biosynthesis glycosyltransferase
MATASIDPGADAAAIAMPLVVGGGPFYEALARLRDLVFGIPALIVLSPLLIGCALAIRMTSPGPAAFRQDRVGRNGVPFRIYKFRTMKVGTGDNRHRDYVTKLLTDGEEEAAADGVFKLADDDRITAVGSFLRRLSIDELPQLINVVSGEMSLVGPRPGIDYEVELYRPEDRARLLVKPGMTGLWQATERNQVGMREMFDLDRRYVRDRSIGLDFEIMVKTVGQMVQSSGAR